MGIRRFMKLSVFLLLFSAIGKATAQKALMEVGRMRLDFGRHRSRDPEGSRARWDTPFRAKRD